MTRSGRLEEGATGSLLLQAAAIGVLALLLGATDYAGATLVGGVNVAPYSHTHQTSAKGIEFSGCSTVSARPGAWLPTTGLGTNRVNATTHQCASTVTGGSDADAVSGTILALGLSLGSNGSYTISANEVFDLAAADRVSTAGGCPAAVPSNSSYTYSFCYVDSSVIGYADAWLVDASNGSYYNGTLVPLTINDSYTYSLSYCNSGSCAWSNWSSLNSSWGLSGLVSVNLTVGPTSALVSSHAYWLFLALYFEGYVVTYSASDSVRAGYLGGATGDASVDLASTPHSWSLAAVTIT